MRFAERIYSLFIPKRKQPEGVDSATDANYSVCKHGSVKAALVSWKNDCSRRSVSFLAYFQHPYTYLALRQSNVTTNTSMLNIQIPALFSRTPFTETCLPMKRLLLIITSAGTLAPDSFYPFPTRSSQYKNNRNRWLFSQTMDIQRYKAKGAPSLA